MEILKLIDNLISSSAIVRWALLSSLLVTSTTVVVLYFSGKKKDLELVLLRTEVAKAADALYRQNARIRELGEQSRIQKKVMEQAVKSAEQLAIKTSKQLDDIKNIKLTGTCDEKVKQSLEALNGK